MKIILAALAASAMRLQTQTQTQTKTPAGLTEMTVADGKKCMGFTNDFRADPSSIPPKGADASTVPGSMDPQSPDLQWADELYKLALEHSID